MPRSPQVLRRKECVRRAIVPGSTGTDDLAYAPRWPWDDLFGRERKKSAAGSGRRTLVLLQLNNSAAGGVHEFAQRCSATSSALNQLLGDELAALLIAAIRELRAYLFEHHVQFALGGF